MGQYCSHGPTCTQGLDRPGRCRHRTEKLPLGPSHVWSWAGSPSRGEGKGANEPDLNSRNQLEMVVRTQRLTFQEARSLLAFLMALLPSDLLAGDLSHPRTCSFCCLAFQFKVEGAPLGILTPHPVLPWVLSRDWALFHICQGWSGREGGRQAGI